MGSFRDAATRFAIARSYQPGDATFQPNLDRDGLEHYRLRGRTAVESLDARS